MKTIKFVLGILVVMVLSGCGGGLYPVQGTVSYENGAPVEEGTIVGEAVIESKTVMAQSNISKDGKFSWGMNKPGDGALPGTYKVIVLPRTLSEAEQSRGSMPAVDRKYSNYESSGITFEVKGQQNVFDVKVQKPVKSQN